MKGYLFILFVFLSISSFAEEGNPKGDTTHIFNKIDTTYIEDYHDMFTLRTIAVTRYI